MALQPVAGRDHFRPAVLALAAASQRPEFNPEYWTYFMETTTNLRCGLLQAILHRDDHFSSRVAFFQIPDRFSNLAQRVAPVDHGHYLAGFKKVFDKKQILLVGPGQQVAHCLSPGPGDPGPDERSLEQLTHGPSGQDIDPVGARRTPVIKNRTVSIGRQNQVISS